MTCADVVSFLDEYRELISGKCLESYTFSVGDVVRTDLPPAQPAWIPYDGGSLHAYYAANALGSMVDRFAYVWLVLHEPFELDEAARTLGLLWARSLGLGARGVGRAGRAVARSGTAPSTWNVASGELARYLAGARVEEPSPERKPVE